MISLDDLRRLKETTSLSKKWIENTKAVPKQVALWIINNELRVCAVYWQGNSYGVWDDENAVSMTNLIFDLPKIKYETN